MKQKIRQIIYDMRRQPLISGVTFIATVMSVFLFMIVAITSRVKTVPFAPESCRDRLMVGRYINIKEPNGNGDNSGGASYHTIKLLYDGLDGVEQISFMSQDSYNVPVRGTENGTFQATARTVDAAFFKIFDHELIAGRYFTAAESAADLPVVVISESTARKAFGKADATGMPITLNHKKYTVIGVVKDTSALATTAHGDVFFTFGTPATPAQSDDIWSIYFGGVSAALLIKDGVDFQSIRDQVKARYANLDTELKPLGWEAVYHESPYDQEVLAMNIVGSNVTPDTSGERKMRYVLYAILLIVPAINLSNLLHSRMHKRITEIGVRRAFGCTRSRIITDIIWENFLITLAGGLAGVALGVIFAMTYSGLYENIRTFGTEVTPAISSVLNWGTILIAVAVCFILNIISASIPAWQASRLNPVEAINNK